MRSRAEAVLQRSQALMAHDDEAFVALMRQQQAVTTLDKLQSQERLDEALAVVAEASFRITGRRPYEVQLMGALALAQGFAIEMSTGEGKTLTASLAAVLSAWRGGPVHVVTSNEYLAQRDAEELGGMYNYCGLSCGFAGGDMSPEDLRLAYAKNITYATSGQLLADHLKDKMIIDAEQGTVKDKVWSLPAGLAEQRVMRGLNSVIVDEADSVLVDDATTPLIISFPMENPSLQEATMAAHGCVQHLSEEEDYRVYQKSKVVQFTDAGKAKVLAAQASFPESWRVKARCLFMVKQALNARYFYQLDRQYVIQEDKIVIVDEKTGRLMPSRSWSHGLHQAVEAKEGLPLSAPTKTTVKMSFQNFFRKYRYHCGMSGTFQLVRHELWGVYGMPVIKIPKRLPDLYRGLGDQIFIDQADKVRGIVAHVQEVQAMGRPVLIGVRSIKDSEAISTALWQAGIENSVLNAKSLSLEAEIIAGAGARGKVTIATNMAGRGTDILLSEEVVALGGLHVVATERHDSRRVDLQLFGRASRQGQPGSGVAMLSLEDALLQRMLSKKVVELLTRAHGLPFGRGMIRQAYIILQIMAEKFSSRQRVKILERDMEFQKLMSFAKH